MKSTFKSNAKAPCVVGEPFVPDSDLIAKKKRWAPNQPPGLPGHLGQSPFAKYRAVLRSGCAIVVPDGAQAADLFARGSYGKGLLSRTRPDFENRRKKTLARLHREQGFVSDIVASRRPANPPADSAANMDDISKVYNYSGMINGVSCAGSLLPSRPWWTEKKSNRDEVAGPCPSEPSGGDCSLPARRRTAGHRGSFERIDFLIDYGNGAGRGVKRGWESPAGPGPSRSVLPATAQPAAPKVSVSSTAAYTSIVKIDSKRKERRVGPTSYAQYASQTSEQLEASAAALRGRQAELTHSLVGPPLGDGEPLLLHPVEAFFLHRDMTCLDIHDGSSDLPMSTASLWDRFVREDARFAASYAAYHFFRARNWCPKSGLKFGTDWILYHGGPEYSHAAFQVLVCPELGPGNAAVDAPSPSSEILQRFGANPLRWPTIHHLSRLAEGVCKLLCVCRVFVPQGLAGAPVLRDTVDGSFDRLIDGLVAAGPECIDSFEIQTSVIRRWTNKELDESEAGRNW